MSDTNTNTNTNTNINFIAFKAITVFINDLNEFFSDTNHSIKLYHHLISKMTLSNEKAIKKNNEVFKTFCIENREGIINQDIKRFTKFKIEYSPKVYIDLTKIFQYSDKTTINSIWKHLLTISAILDPEGKAKEVLKNNKDDNESDFVSDIISKVEEHVKPGSNPLEAISSIMSSGIFTDILSNMNSGMKDGSLDLGKLMGSVQKICSKFGTELPEGTIKDGQIDPMAMMNMVGGLINKQDGKSDGNAQPDLTAMLGNLLNQQQSSGNEGPKLDILTMIGPLLTTLTQKPNINIEEIENMKLE